MKFRVLTRKVKDRLVHRLLLLPAIFVTLIAVAITVVLASRSQEILSLYTIPELLFSSVWRPLAGEFGFYPFIISSIVVTLLAMAIAIPISLFSAIYLAEYAPSRIRRAIQPFVDLLAGIPSVIFGLFGILLIIPLIRDYIAPLFNEISSGYSVLAGSVVLAIMVFPILIAVTYEVIQSVPSGMKEAALACGATRWEMVKHVVLRAGIPGIFAAIILSFARAFGETMAVLMVVGNVPKVPESVFDPAYPIPALIANNYGEMMSIPLYDSALMFAALLLLVIVVIFIIFAKLLLRQIRLRVMV